MPIQGLINLSALFLCKKEVLGEVMTTLIGGVKTDIHFPVFPELDEETPTKGFRAPLLSPKIAEDWKRGDEPLRWGYPKCYPGCESVVELLAFSVECTEQNKFEKARAVRSGMKAWGKAFFDYLTVAAKQGAQRDFSQLNKSFVRMEFVDVGHIPGLVADTMHLSVPKLDSYAAKSQIKEALEFAASGKELRLEYQMMLSAYDALRDLQNRQAIVDACSAVELCLEDYISRRVKELGFSSAFFLDKFKSLGDRIDLAKQLDKSFPKEDHQALIVKPRNDIAHNREVYPSNETTDALISCVERCLQHYFTGYY